MSCPSRLAFSLLAIGFFMPIFMVDRHCLAKAMLITSGVDTKHANGYGRRARFMNPAGVAVKDSCTFVIKGTGGRKQN